MALKRVWMASPNFTGGNNGRRLLVIHSSEGAQTYQSLGNFFAQSSAQVSSHVGIDNAVRGTIGEYVKRGNSAWTASNANMVAVQAELCTPSGASANWSRDTWLSKDTMLRNLADWLKEESKATGIPLTLLNDSQAQGSGRGICQHRNLGAWGGGHVDCGPNFPIDYVMDLVKGGSGTAPTKGPAVMSMMMLPAVAGQKVQVAWPYGATNIRLMNADGATYQIRWRPEGVAPNGTATCSSTNIPQWKIPPDCRGAVLVRQDSGTTETGLSAG